MHKITILITSLLVAFAMVTQAESPRSESVLSSKEQQALTPDQVLNALKEGNRRFLAGDITERDHSAQVREAALGQFPKAVVLSCVDSRIPVEDVFDRGIGDIFVARVAGNFENTDILGSMEFATKVSGAKLVLVLGHDDCGAVKAAIDGAELGNITAMLTNIQPAITALSDYAGVKSSKNEDFVNRVTVKNIELTISDIRSGSPIMKDMEDQGLIKMVGALYDMNTGAITFFE
jgi:carbonic anhydrase